MSKKDIINSFKEQRKSLLSTYKTLSSDINNLSEDNLFSLKLIDKFIPIYEFGYSDYINILTVLLNKLQNIQIKRFLTLEKINKIEFLMKQKGSKSMISKLECENELYEQIRLDSGEIEYRKKMNRIWTLKNKCEGLILEYCYFKRFV
uniref:Uncharacterized protein n=1 Tax=viral metagenome TaxID=1070528 RepID=A0A6C0BCX7_9ZZZZ